MLHFHILLSSFKSFPDSMDLNFIIGSTVSSNSQSHSIKHPPFSKGRFTVNPQYLLLATTKHEEKKELKRHVSYSALKDRVWLRTWLYKIDVSHSDEMTSKVLILNTGYQLQYLLSRLVWYIDIRIVFFMTNQLTSVSYGKSIYSWRYCWSKWKQFDCMCPRYTLILNCFYGSC